MFQALSNVMSHDKSFIMYLYLTVVYEFYYTKLIISCLKNTRPLYLTASVAYRPLSDSSFMLFISKLA